MSQKVPEEPAVAVQKLLGGPATERNVPERIRKHSPTQNLIESFRKKYDST